jgi:hypothetical protein
LADISLETYLKSMIMIISLNKSNFSKIVGQM